MEGGDRNNAEKYCAGCRVRHAVLTGEGVTFRSTLGELARRCLLGRPESRGQSGFPDRLYVLLRRTLAVRNNQRGPQRRPFRTLNPAEERRVGSD